MHDTRPHKKEFYRGGSPDMTKSLGRLLGAFASAICALAGLALGFLALGIAPVAAQTSYPTKAITIIVPAAPGGVTDALGRTLAKHFSESWGQQVIVENRPGANNQIAAEYVSKAPADGSVLFIGPEVTFTVNPSLYPKLNYDPVKDFTPITGLVIINHAL